MLDDLVARAYQRFGVTDQRLQCGNMITLTSPVPLEGESAHPHEEIAQALRHLDDRRAPRVAGACLPRQRRQMHRGRIAQRRQARERHQLRESAVRHRVGGDRLAQHGDVRQDRWRYHVLQRLQACCALRVRAKRIGDDTQARRGFLQQAIHRVARAHRLRSRKHQQRRRIRDRHAARHAQHRQRGHAVETGRIVQRHREQRREGPDRHAQSRRADWQQSNQIEQQPDARENAHEQQHGRLRKGGDQHDREQATRRAGAETLEQQ